MSSSTRDHDESTESDLAAVVEEFEERRRAGGDVDHEELAGRHPEHRERILAMLRTLEMLGTVEPGSSGSGRLAGPPLAIEKLGEYVLEREIGRGGMGVVFLARDEELGRKVALKLLPLHTTLDPRQLERFRREARAAAGLEHPNIVPVHGVGESEGLHYYVMRHIEGDSLAEIVRLLRDPEEVAVPSVETRSGLATRLLRDELESGTDSGPVPEVRDGPGQTAPPPRPLRHETYDRNVARIGLQVASALAHAHSRGVLHRDVKPANLILDHEGRAWVTDFGLCKTRGAEDLTIASDLIGTLRYMAPEQFDGRADVRSDVYQIGITLYELLTLETAFRGNDKGALIRAVVDQVPRRPRRLRDSIPVDLEAIVLKATAKLPEERYGTADALADDLRAFLAGEPVLARPPSALRLLRLVVRRNRALAATIALSLVGLVAGLVLYLAGLRRARAEQDAQLYAASIVAASTSLGTDLTSARRHLDRAPEHLRDWEWNHLAARLDDSVELVERVRDPVRAVDVSRDGRLLAFVEHTGTLHVRELASGGRRWRLATAGSHPARLSVAPGGDSLVTGASHTAQAWSLEGAPTVMGTWDAGIDVESVAHDPEGRRVFVGLLSGEVHVFDAALSVELDVLATPFPVDSMVVTDAGATLVTGHRGGEIRVTDLATRESRVLEGHTSGVESLDATLDGLRLVSGGRDGTVRLWDLPEGRQLRLWPVHAGWVHSVRFSPDERLLVSSSQDHTLAVLDPDDVHALYLLRGHLRGVYGLSFLPDGDLLSVSEEGMLRRWDPRIAGGRTTLSGQLADTFGIAFDAAGTRLAAVNRDRTIRVWDLGTGEVQRVLVCPRPLAYSVGFVPDGRRLVTGHSDGSLRFWNIENGTVEHVVAPTPEVTGVVEGMTFTSDGSRMVGLVKHHGLVSWRLTEGGVERAEELLVPGALSFDSSRSTGRIAVGTEEGEVLLFERGSLRLLERRAVSSPAPALSVRLADGASALVVGSTRGILYEWRLGAEKVRSLEVQQDLEAEFSMVDSIDLSPDGRRLVISSTLMGCDLWNLERGERLLTLQGPGRGYVLPSFSPDGKRLACGSYEGVIRVWDTLAVDDRDRRLSLAPDHLRRARALFEETFAELGDFDRTEEALRARADADDPVLREALRLVHERSGTLEGLLHRTSRILRRPGEGEEPSDALALADALGKEHFSDPRVRCAIGEASLRSGRFEDAVRLLEPVTRSTARDDDVAPYASALLAMAQIELGLTDRAEATLRAGRARTSGRSERIDELDALFREASARLEARRGE